MEMESRRRKFYETDLAPLHQRALASSVASQHMNGLNISFDRAPLASTFNIQGENLGRRDFAHLFWVLDSSSASLERTVQEGGDGAPPGIYVVSKNYFIDDDHYIKVGVYKRRSLLFLNLNSVFVDHVFLDKTRSPKAMGLVAFVLCAMTAYQMGFRSVRLLAAGGVDRRRPKPGYCQEYYGYYVWPKFGFDARLRWYERLDRRLWRCATVQQVRRIDEDLWKINGFQRFMTFDLRPSSTSWKILLDYASARI